MPGGFHRGIKDRERTPQQAVAYLSFITSRAHFGATPTTAGVPSDYKILALIKLTKAIKEWDFGSETQTLKTPATNGAIPAISVGF
jgi:hypothetical protein